jgi:hypothetical protein
LLDLARGGNFNRPGNHSPAEYTGQLVESFLNFSPPYSLYCGDSRVFRFIASVGPGRRKPTFFFWGLHPVIFVSTGK